MSLSPKALEIGKAFNCGPLGNEVIDELAHEHRTIQQNMMRFCVKYIKRIAQETYYDDRNAASVELAKALLNVPGVEEILDRPLPFI